MNTKKNKISSILLLAVLFLIIALISAFFLLRTVGKRNLKANAVRTTETVVADTEMEEEGIVYRNGIKYRYNEDLYTILVVGTDSRAESFSELGEGEEGAGQADAIFLAVIDETNNKISMISIPRDTMTEIDVYDSFGQYYNTVTEHLALQYSYGDGAELSCEMMEKAVSNLMYGIPIHAYASINMNAIGVMNDAIGGVTLEVLEDIDEDYGSLHKKGQTYTLKGDEARLYVQGRDEEADYSAINRLARQKQYMIAFINQALDATQKDLTLPVKIYNTVIPYVVTDLDVSEITYLSTVALSCGFSEGNLHIIQGQQVKGSVYEEYHIEEDKLKDLVIDVFYTPVD